MLKMLSLFSGIGGIDLAAQWAGIETVAFCEIEPFCQKVLRKNFGKDIVIFDDARTLTAESLSRAGIRSVDIIAGGFPCQDISEANQNATGIGGSRSGLWREMLRLISELRPRYVIVENVTALLGRGISRVVGDLVEIGYDTEWEAISACSFDAPHTRERVFVIAYPCSIERHYGRNLDGEDALYSEGQWEAAQNWKGWQDVQHWIRQTVQDGVWDEPTPALRGVVNGIPNRVDRIRGLGNAVVPQQVYPILKAIAEIEASMNRSI